MFSIKILMKKQWSWLVPAADPTPWAGLRSDAVGWFAFQSWLYGNSRGTQISPPFLFVSTMCLHLLLLFLLPSLAMLSYAVGWFAFQSWLYANSRGTQTSPPPIFRNCFRSFVKNCRFDPDPWKSDEGGYTMDMFGFHASVYTAIAVVYLPSSGFQVCGVLTL